MIDALNNARMSFRYSGRARLPSHMPLSIATFRTKVGLTQHTVSSDVVELRVMQPDQETMRNPGRCNTLFSRIVRGSWHKKEGEGTRSIPSEEVLVESSSLPPTQPHPTLSVEGTDRCCMRFYISQIWVA